MSDLPQTLYGEPRGEGAQFTREDVAALAAEWARLPEGHIDAPMLMVPMTPAATLLLMDTFGMDAIDATAVFADPPPVRASQMTAVVPLPGPHPFMHDYPPRDTCARDGCGAFSNAAIHQQRQPIARATHGPR